MIFIISIFWIVSLVIVWRLGFKLGYNLLELEKDDTINALRLQTYKMYEELKELREFKKLREE